MSSDLQLANLSYATAVETLRLGLAPVSQGAYARNLGIQVIRGVAFDTANAAHFCAYVIGMQVFGIDAANAATVQDGLTCRATDANAAYAAASHFRLLGIQFLYIYAAHASIVYKQVGGVQTVSDYGTNARIHYLAD